MKFWLRELNFYYIHHLKTQKIHNFELMSHDMMRIVNNTMEFLILSLFSFTKFNIKYIRNRQSNQSKILKRHIHLIFGMTTHTML
jgi:hypothetical protein